MSTSGKGVRSSGRKHVSMIQSLGTHAKISRKITAVMMKAVSVMRATGCIPMSSSVALAPAGPGRAACSEPSGWRRLLALG
jgi:hypothetical protein